MADVLHQFKVHDIFPIGATQGEQLTTFGFTNASLFMVAAVVCTTLFLLLGMRNKKLVPGRWQSMVEMSYELVAGTVKDNVGNDGRKFFPFIFTLFMFILFCNLLGMIPFVGYTVTSHIVVTFALAAFVFIGVTIVGFAKHGLHFFSFFIPDGLPFPWIMIPIMLPIEMISYLARPISLSLRLAANMVGGHILIKVIASFIGFATIGAGAVGVVSIGFLMFLTGMELFVAVLQAYVFTLLTCLYLNDAINLH
jgi:F-type H+-transporting ATPase subunit a